MSLIFKNYASSLTSRVPLVNGRLSLYRIDSVYQMETSLSHAFWSINAKSMVYCDKAKLRIYDLHAVIMFDPDPDGDAGLACLKSSDV
jgi:hypothetical protein